MVAPLSMTWSDDSTWVALWAKSCNLVKRRLRPAFGGWTSSTANRGNHAAENLGIAAESATDRSTISSPVAFCELPSWKCSDTLDQHPESSRRFGRHERS